MLRGDLYKHRTSPYSFQGLGVDGLAMVAEQRARFGLPWVAEVLDVRHLDDIADVVDVVRVGCAQHAELRAAARVRRRPASP